MTQAVQTRRFRVALSFPGEHRDRVEKTAEALGEIRRRPPSVLVSDIAMPDDDGYALIRKLRALGPERGGNIPAIALTRQAKRGDRTRALAAGFQSHVPKPVDAVELTVVIANLTGRLGGHSVSTSGPG